MQKYFLPKCAEFPTFNFYFNPNISAHEIDVIETDYTKPSMMPTNIHICYKNNPPQPTDCPSGITDQYPQKVFVSNYANSYHKFAVEWDPQKIIFYFDDVIVHNTVNPGVFDPMAIVLGGGPTSIPTYNAGFPYKIYVDYIRAYKLKDNCNQSINTCSYNFSTHNNKVKELINIGGNGCTNNVAVGSNIYLRASNYVQLSGDFNVPVGATFFADANNVCNNGSMNYHCSYPLFSCNYNFSGYNNETKTRIQLGGTGCSASVANGNNVSLKAIEAITLEPGFKADLGSVTEMKIVTCQ